MSFTLQTRQRLFQHRSIKPGLKGNQSTVKTLLMTSDRDAATVCEEEPAVWILSSWIKSVFLSWFLFDLLLLDTEYFLK